MLFLLSGCTNYNSSPDKVALEMVKRMSDSDYKEISELVFLPDNGFVDSSSFKRYLEDKDLLIEGNKTYGVINYNAPKKEEKNVRVTIKTDDKYINVNTIKKDKKWYVNLGNNYYDDLVFYVPVGSKVFLNGTELVKESYKSKEM